MRTQAMLPSESYVWLVLAPRVEEKLRLQNRVIWEHIGLFEEYGPLDENFTGLAEGRQLIKELTGLLLWAIVFELSHRQCSIAERHVGRPPDPIIPHLGPPLLACFLRYRDFCRTKIGSDVD